MLSYDEALARILDAVSSGPLPAEPVPLADARGRALAHDLFASGDLPPFANSSVDGYAVRIEDTREATAERPIPLRVTQTIPAGRASEKAVATGEAARIFTGAPLPPGADGLVMVEDTRTEPNGAGEGDTVLLHAPGSATLIRTAGSDLARGALALPAGTTLDPGAVGLLAALNIAAPLCPRRPRVALLTTGDEIVPPAMRSTCGPARSATPTARRSPPPSPRPARVWPDGTTPPMKNRPFVTR
jgi:molybdopterin molybdotransferase